MIDVNSIPISAVTVVRHGITLPWVEVERYGSDLLYTHGPREGEQMYPDRKRTGEVRNQGEVFIPLGTLEELMEAENSWGMGGSFQLGYHEGMALEQAGLATRETRGGFHSREEQKAALDELIDRLYEVTG